MAKATKKSKKAGKRTVTCGSCKEPGHNARTCPTKGEIKSSKDIPPPPITGRKTRIDERQEQTKRRMSTVPRRLSPTKDTGTGATAPPYRCEKCNAIAILVIVKIKDHNASYLQKKEVFTGQMRCELCMNKPTPSDLILVWGATPGQTVDVVDA